MKLMVFAAVLATALSSSIPPYRPTYSPPTRPPYSPPTPPPYQPPTPPPYSPPTPPPYQPPTSSYQQNVPQIVSQQFDRQDDGSYVASYETENGIRASESGKSVAGYGGEPSLAVQGQYSYVGYDGVTYTVTYTADANGFQPQGAHLPTPVPTEYPLPQVPSTPASYQAVPPQPAQTYQPYQPTYQ